MKNVIVICGATATSKTKFAVALAEKLNTEVVSADCMLVYRGLDIGTAKPTKAEMRGVPHHLIDVAAPNERFSVGDYRTAALPVTEKLLAEGKQPIICGGTGFYIDSLLYESAFGSAGASDVSGSKSAENVPADQSNKGSGAAVWIILALLLGVGLFAFLSTGGRGGLGKWKDSLSEMTGGFFGGRRKDR